MSRVYCGELRACWAGVFDQAQAQARLDQIASEHADGRSYSVIKTLPGMSCEGVSTEIIYCRTRKKR